MFVIKRNGKKEEVKLDKVTNRVRVLSKGLKVEPFLVAQKVIGGLYDGVSTKEIDKLLAETAAVLTSEHPDYSKLAGRIATSSLHKETKGFFDTMKLLYKEGNVSEKLISIVKENRVKIEKAIDDERDFDLDYFGFKTLEKSYLLRHKGKVAERPQHMFMRVALGICEDKNNLKDAIELYDLMSNGYYTHATPTLFNAGTKRPQMSSCFLINMESDSIEGIFNTLKECALISKNAGGIGLSISKIRGSGTQIKGTNGTSNGLVPMLKVFNSTAVYVDQGGGKRKGSISTYLEPWHSDIEAFLDLKKNIGKEELRARDLFLALWIPDLFMQRVEEDGIWSLMCPHECPGLDEVFDSKESKKFTELYTKYESDGKYRKQIKARDLMIKIIESQIETGVPYIGYKDAANAKSNQKNLGVIKSSNLCIEVIEYSSPEETAVCNLASICLPKYVKMEKGKLYFDFDLLGKVVEIATENLNKVINLNYYPTEKTAKSNFRHRPIGIGVQGLADVFFKMSLPYDSPEARKLNIQIFETIYYHALLRSCQMAKRDGRYDTFDDSPASKGILQFDMWGVTPSDRYDWKKLKEDIKENGLRNSLLVALMPTASSSQIYGNTESFEMLTSNLYKRSVLSGEFIVINKYLVSDLEKLGLWKESIRNKILEDNGSVQNLDIPQNIKDIYKTVWETSQKAIIDMAADRGPYICQSQSMNLYLPKPNFSAINSMHFYAWKKGVKTGMYYLRTKPAIDAVKVTTTNTNDTIVDKSIACSLDNPENCQACGS